jgi:predicted TIM-barrel fold metal-dependent hydrolase
MGIDESAPLVVVSSDSHVGPLLREDLRPYCPKKYLDEFDAFAAQYVPTLYNRTDDDDEGAPRVQTAYSTISDHLNLRRPGVHNDPSVRLRDMDYDGVAAEVIFHASQNNEPIPWVGEFLSSPGGNFELAAVGYQIYNRWLADFCAADPERLLGLIHIASWDIDWCVKEVEWARDAGLRGVCFPPPQRPGTLPYNDLTWEPFWSVCAESGFALSTHASGGPTEDYVLQPGGIAINVYETSGYMSRRAVWWLTFGQVFERHPALHLVTAEQFEGWFMQTLLELDQLQLTFSLSDLPRMPSEYVRENVFCGVSFPSRAEVHEAGALYPENFIWGRDYPHVEGVFQALDDLDAEPVCKRSIRDRFAGVAPEATAQMLGLNGVRAYGLDGEYLTKVAAQIDAVTLERIAVAPTPDEIPAPDGRSLAFVGYIGPHEVETDRLAHALTYPGTNPAAERLARAGGAPLPGSLR